MKVSGKQFLPADTVGMRAHAPQVEGARGGETILDGSPGADAAGDPEAYAAQ